MAISGWVVVGDDLVNLDRVTHIEVKRVKGDGLPEASLFFGGEKPGLKLVGKQATILMGHLRRLIGAEGTVPDESTPGEPPDRKKITVR
jgi:hypothetical protein